MPPHSKVEETYEGLNARGQGPGGMLKVDLPQMALKEEDSPWGNYKEHLGSRDKGGKINQKV